MKDWRITRVLTTMADTFLTRRVTRSAAEIAYYMVMALFPVIICMYDLLALILRDPTAVLRIVETLVLPRETQALVSEFLIYVSGNTSQVMFIAALFVMITSASAAFRAMAAIVSEIHGDKRFGIVSSTVVSVAFSVAFLLVLYLCVLLMLTGKRFLLWLDALMPRVSIIWSWTWVRFLVLFAILLMMILVLPAHHAAPDAAPRASRCAVFGRRHRGDEYSALMADRQQREVFTRIRVACLGRDPAVLVSCVRTAAHSGRSAQSCARGNGAAEKRSVKSAKNVIFYGLLALQTAFYHVEYSFKRMEVPKNTLF